MWWYTCSGSRWRGMCLCADVLVCWCTDVLVYLCSGVLMRWCVYVLMCWYAGLLMCLCIYVLICWCDYVLMSWCAGVMKCWCADVHQVEGTNTKKRTYLVITVMLNSSQYIRKKLKHVTSNMRRVQVCISLCGLRCLKYVHFIKFLCQMMLPF